MRWLTSDEVVQLNAWVVEQTGEPHAVLSLGLVESALGRLLNHQAYEDVDDVLWLAVILLFGIARNHAFSQGNKRTGFHAARLFPRRNGYDWLGNDAELGSIIILVIEGKLTERRFYELVAPDVFDFESIERKTRMAAFEAAADKRAETIASFVLADSQQENIRAYLERGRILRDEVDARLDEIFTEEIRAWASSPPPWAPTETLVAVQCEILLRGREIPSNNTIADYLEIIAGHVSKAVESEQVDPARDDIQKRIDKYWEQERGKN